MYKIFRVLIVFCGLTFFISSYVQAQDLRDSDNRPVVCHERLEFPLIPPRYGGPIAPVIPLGEDGLPLPPIPNPPPLPSWELKDEYKMPQFENLAHAFEVKVLNDLDAEAYEQGSIFFHAYKKLLADTDLLYNNALKPYKIHSVQTGSATFFVPSNKAFQSYIEEQGFNTIDDFYIQEPLELKRVVFNHTSRVLYTLKSLFHFDKKHTHPESPYRYSPYYPLRSALGEELKVTDNCVEVFINGVKISTAEIAVYRQEYKYRPEGLKYKESPSFVYFIEGVLVP